HLDDGCLDRRHPSLAGSNALRVAGKLPRDRARLRLWTGGNRAPIATCSRRSGWRILPPGIRRGSRCAVSPAVRLHGDLPLPVSSAHGGARLRAGACQDALVAARLRHGADGGVLLEPHFAVTFVLGVVTGIPLEFQFFTNWAVFS